MKKSLLVLVTFLAIFILAGCGYKPSSYYAKKQIQGNVFVDLFVNIKDPKNSVLIKDAMNEILVHRLDAKLVTNRNEADTIVYVSLGNVSMTELDYDEQGYTKLYRAVVSVNVRYENSEYKNSFSVTGRHEFALDGGSTITDTKRFEAIKSAASKALEEVISKIAVYSFKK
ncbi:hypothetical protein CP960_01110 [Malaciobacter halophilus]|uniref:Uncharacterized protein n=1 Tax=Malaciobacter halophilus TaxID=197482 RepID=A0A2N1J6B3_9BACT|nr:LPS assembly lipoprotein LptE [Malaciobacter halophilus]AXH08861.1 lipooligosaccharide transport system, OM translocon component LptE [Malaciobacter halophilus]PKI82090.1 hypothetical protein CP960_01110 [Malaciobacter halophilus]